MPDVFIHTQGITRLFLVGFFFPFCGSKMKRVDKSDNEEERVPENLKKKRKRIKQLQSDSSDEEGKKMRKQQGM